MKIILCCLLFLFVCNPCISKSIDDGMVLCGSISKVPASFFGTWRVVSTITDTDSPFTFRKNGIDLWNLSQFGNVIKLSNPFNGASAEITVKSEGKSHVVFTKKGSYDGKILTDIVDINIEGEKFSGYDSIKLESFSDIDGSSIKTETAKYKITGERIFSTEN